MSTTLSARDLTHWDQAFQHPLPVVRKLQSQLEQNITSNRENLRSLVGSSYRDLLGTAERIIEMDAQLTSVESVLADLGRKCNTRAVERVVAGSRKFRAREEGGGGAEGLLARTARVKVVLALLGVVGREVKRGGDALVAGKLLVLGRLVVRVLGEGEGVPGVLVELRRRLAGLRKRVLGYVERVLGRREGVDGEVLVNTLCAYALVTSSAAKEVMRYFLQVRFGRLESKAEEPGEQDVMEMLEVYSQTMLDVREIFPRRLAAALAQLSRQPLLKDPQVRGIFELNLGLYEQWISEDVRTFTPYVRSDELAASDATEGLRAWARQVQEQIATAAQECLEEQTSAETVLRMRHDMLSKSLSLNGKLREQSHVQFVGRLREVLLEKLQSLAQELVGNIAIPFELLSSSAGNSSQFSKPWELGSTDFDLQNGAPTFRQSVIQSHSGQDEALRKSSVTLDEWMSKLDSFSAIAKEMRATRWDDELDLDFDDLDSDTSFQDTLSKQDPATLVNTLREHAQKALKTAYQDLQIRSSTDEYAARLLRLHRELDQRQRSLGEWLDAPKLGTDRAYLQSLHDALVRSVFEKPLEQFSRSLRKQKRVSTALWDGTPPLPVQPSPAVFRLLTALHGAMAKAGGDVWSPEAVDRLQNVVTERLSELLKQYLPKMTPEKREDDPAGDPTKAEANAGAKSNNGAVQVLFDALFLWRAFGAASEGPDSKQLEMLITPLKEGVVLDESAIGRLRKSSNDYWKRTYMLFGLLAPHGL